jgi:hypothetical protein
LGAKVSEAVKPSLDQTPVTAVVFGKAQAFFAVPEECIWRTQHCILHNKCYLSGSLPILGRIKLKSKVYNLPWPSADIWRTD